MPFKISEDEIDDLIYLSRTGEDVELAEMLAELANREKVTKTQVIEAARDDSSATCLHMAAANGHTKVVTLILSQFPSPARASKTASTEVSFAEASSSGGASEKSPTPTSSSSLGPSYVDVKNSYGNTALHWACLGGHLDLVKLLLSRGASPTETNDKDQIPLDLAAFNNHMHVVEHFLSQSKGLESANAEKGGLENSTRDIDVDNGPDSGSENNTNG
ncbi:ankyrin [Durotheca rogersii]|uniref:ankyrin n=1 Tax=Durotheca rogersii TaxID=419775 RepID=UPI0022212384|nr:ankyrin [Durotheca rogersii]KAI5859522.1 ankyrin [Durotheca rogersii]